VHIKSLHIIIIIVIIRLDSRERHPSPRWISDQTPRGKIHEKNATAKMNERRHRDMGPLLAIFGVIM